MQFNTEKKELRLKQHVKLRVWCQIFIAKIKGDNCMAKHGMDCKFNRFDYVQEVIDNFS